MKKVHSQMLFCFLFFFSGFIISANAGIYPFHNTFTGSQEVPPNASTAQGTIVGTYDDVTNTISYTIIFSGLTNPASAAHFHAPAVPGVNAGVIIGYTGFPNATSGTYTNSHVLTDVQEAHLFSGLVYSNIHNSTFPGGELRTQIILGDPNTTSPFRLTYSGSQEVPPNSSTATGMIIGSYNHATNTIAYSIIFSGLTMPASAAHFHAPAVPGVNAGVIIGYTGFPNATEGFYSNSHVLTDQQETWLLSGLMYSNIHNSTFPGGELRTQIILTDILAPVISAPVANPSTLWPPNHKMKDVTVNYTSTDNFPGVNCLLSVSSNEEATSQDDNTIPDWVIVNNNMVQLRAERNGGGNGRIYTVTVTCTDQQGNSSSSSTTVAVPHDNSSITRINGVVTENNGKGLSFKVFPNPSVSYFTLDIQPGNRSGKMSIKLIDELGRTVESINDLIGSQVVRMGNNLKAGIYIIELRQGKEVKQVKLVKSK